MHYSFNELAGIQKKAGQRVPVIMRCRLAPVSKLAELAEEVRRSQQKAKRPKNRYIHE